MDPQFILVIIFAMVTAIVYCAWNYITKTDPGEFLLKRLVASIVFGIFLGIVTIYTVAETGMEIADLNFPFMAGLFTLYSGILVYINRGIDYIWLTLFGQKIGQEKKTGSDPLKG